MDEWIGLAARARSGDRDALERLLECAAGLAHATARAHLGDSLAAQEAAVQALARAARGIATLKDPAAFPGWLRRIAIRCALDQRSRPPVVAMERDGRADARPGPVETLVAAERRQRVRSALAALPAKLREPVLLHYAEGLSYRDIAAILGAGVGTVHRRIAKAHDLLQQTLRETA